MTSPALRKFPPMSPHDAPSDAPSLQLQLERSERLRTLGEMAAAQAHYMNNVLGALVSHIEVLRLNPADEATVREFTDSMRDTCRKAAAATRTLSEFARPAKPEDLIEL